MPTPAHAVHPVGTNVVGAREERARAAGFRGNLLTSRALALVLAASMFPLGCFSEATAGGAGAKSELHQSAHDRDFVIHAEDGSSVTIGPGTALQFELEDGTLTEEHDAAELSVSEEGVILGEATDASAARYRWSQVHAIHTKNLHEGETIVAVVAVTAVIVGVIAIVASTKGKGGDVFVKALEVPVRVAAHVPDLKVHGSGGSCCGSSSSSSSGGSGGSSDPWTWQDTPPPVITADVAPIPPPDARHMAPLFTDEAVRKSRFQVVASLDGAGTPWAKPTDVAPMGTALVSFRFKDFFELGFGYRMLAPGAPSTSVYGMFLTRFDMLARLDAHRRLAIVVGDAFGGGGRVSFHEQVDLGLRVRLWDDLALGLYPFNPTYTRWKEAEWNALSTSRWSFPTRVELTASF